MSFDANWDDEECTFDREEQRWSKCDGRRCVCRPSKPEPQQLDLYRVNTLMNLAAGATFVQAEDYVAVLAGELRR